MVVATRKLRMAINTELKTKKQAKRNISTNTIFGMGKWNLFITDLFDIGNTLELWFYFNKAL